MEVGARVTVDGSRGTVRYIGPVATSKTEGAVYAGIEWDDGARGKNDGAYKGERYFEAGGPSSGLFARPPKVVRGAALHASGAHGARVRVRFRGRSPNFGVQQPRNPTDPLLLPPIFRALPRPLPPHRRAATFRKRGLTTKTRTRAGLAAQQRAKTSSRGGGCNAGGDHVTTLWAAKSVGLLRNRNMHGRCECNCAGTCSFTIAVRVRGSDERRE